MNPFYQRPRGIRFEMCCVGSFKTNVMFGCSFVSDVRISSFASSYIIVCVLYCSSIRFVSYILVYIDIHLESAFSMVCYIESLHDSLYHLSFPLWYMSFSCNVAS